MIEPFRKLLTDDVCQRCKKIGKLDWHIDYASRGDGRWPMHQKWHAMTTFVDIGFRTAKRAIAVVLEASGVS